jgi:TolB-like protein/DNA-binding winged helix-turn-helix (wHTH) protein/thioredoxin-like negative regulator of GroEL
MTQKTDVGRDRRYAFGPFQMQGAERRLCRDGAEIPLTRKAFDLLLALVEGAGRLQTREALIETLWPDTIVEEHSLTWNVSTLRKALGDTGDTPHYIETVRGHGYRFIAEVQVDEAAALRHFLTRDGPESSGKTFAASIPDASEARRAASRARTYRWLVAAVVLLVVLVAAAFMVLRSPSSRILVGTSSPHSIAVLPFDNMSPDPANAYFAGGIQEIILTKLAGIGDLRVLSRAATRSFESHPADMSKIAAQLGVEAVLTGSVQRIDDRVLINVQLIDGSNGSHLWAQTYPRTLEGVFEVESEVAENVVEALKATLLPAEAVRVARAPTDDEHAYDDFLTAEFLAAQVWRENAQDPVAATREARALYRQAIGRDPRFTLAWARLAYLDIHAYAYRVGVAPYAFDTAEQAAAKALELDPDLPQARLAYGYVRYYAHRDFEGALTEFQRARRGMPEDGEIDAAIANAQRRLGQWELSIGSYERAVALDPHDSRWPMQLGDALASVRRYDEALRAYDRAQAADPGDHAATVYKSTALLYAGRPEQALQVLDSVPREFELGGAVTSIRFDIECIRGDAKAAFAALDGASEWVESAYLPNKIPISLLQAQAWELAGDSARARAAYQAARIAIQPNLANPDTPIFYSVLGLIEAGLGNKQAALDAGRRSLELVPVDRESGNGSSRLFALADIEIRVGEVDAAAKHLHELLLIPAGRMISAPLIQVDPRYAAVREALRASGDIR